MLNEVFSRGELRHAALLHLPTLPTPGLRYRNAPFILAAYMQFLAVILLSITAAVLYGIVHDQVTARICVEYFTIGHPPIFQTNSPTLLGLGWGILATWWVGLILGIPLAVVARCGRRPALRARQLVRPVLVLLACMACAAFLAGLVGHFVASAGGVKLMEPMASLVPPDRHVAFVTDLWAHLASYTSGFLGGIILIVWTWRKRKSTANPPAA